MMKFKKLFTIVMTSTLILAGCGGSKTPTTNVEFFTDKAGETAKSLEKMSSEISTLGGEAFTPVVYSEVQAYETTVLQSLESDKAPGLFTWWSGDKLNQLIEKDLIEDLTEEWEEYYVKEGVAPGVADAFTVDGKVYAAPFSVLYNGAIYNKEVFEKYNLEVPKTWEEFVQIGETLIQNGVTPVGLKNDPWASFLWFQIFIAGTDQALYNDLVAGNVKYTDEKIKNAMKEYQKLIQKGFFGEPVDPNAQVRKFTEGEYAIIYEPTTTSTALGKDFDFKAGEDYDMFAIPSISGQKSMIFYETSPIVIAKNSAQKDAAKKVLRDYYKSEVQQIAVDEMGFVNTDKTEVKDIVNANFVKEASNEKDNQLIMRYYESTPSSIVNVATDELWKFFYNPTDEILDETLQTIQKEADKVFSA